MVGHYHGYLTNVLWGSLTLRHNHIRNVTTELLSQVTKEVKIEPALPSLTGETFEQRTANTSDYARLDISARGFGPNIKWHSSTLGSLIQTPKGMVPKVSKNFISTTKK